MPVYNIVYDINNNNSCPAVVANKLYYWFRRRNMLHNRTNESLWPRSRNIFPMINPMEYRKSALKFMLQELHSITAHSTCSGNMFSRAF